MNNISFSSDGPDPARALRDPLVLALLEALGAHALILDPELRLLGWDEGAAQALGLPPGPQGPDVLPALARTAFASRGFRLCRPPMPLGPEGPHLWVFQDVSGSDRRGLGDRTGVP